MTLFLAGRADASYAWRNGPHRTPQAIRQGAAAGCGDRTKFERYWTLAASMLDGSPDHHIVAESWLNLARGAASLRDRDRVEMAAGRARDLSYQLRLSQLQFEAEAVLDSARAPVPQRSPEPVTALEGADELALALVRSLEATARG